MYMLKANNTTFLCENNLRARGEI